MVVIRTTTSGLLIVIYRLWILDSTLGTDLFLPPSSITKGSGITSACHSRRRYYKHPHEAFDIKHHRSPYPNITKAKGEPQPHLLDAIVLASGSSPRKCPLISI